MKIKISSLDRTRLKKALTDGERVTFSDGKKNLVLGAQEKKAAISAEHKMQLTGLVNETVIPAIFEDLGIEIASDYNECIDFLCEKLQARKK